MKQENKNFSFSGDEPNVYRSRLLLASLAIVCEGTSVKPTRTSVSLFFLFGCFSFSNRRENVPTRHCAKSL